MARRKTTIQRDPLGRLASEYEELEEENENFDSRGLLKDGHAMRVKMYMRDGVTPNPYLSPVQRSIAATHQPLVVDGTSKPNAMNRPGFRYLADTTRRAIHDAVKNEAYEEADEIAANAWRHPSAQLDYAEHTGGDPSRTGAGAPGKGTGAPAGAYPYSAAAEGTSCSIDGRPGTLQRQGNWLVCRPTQRQDAMGLDAKQQAYAAYDEEQANAWRGSNR